MRNVSRTLTPACLTPALCAILKTYLEKSSNETNKGVEGVPALPTGTFDTFESMERFNSFMMGERSEVSGLPLSYIGRDTEAILLEIDDPIFGDPASVYETELEELTERGPFYMSDANGVLTTTKLPYYKQDNNEYLSYLEHFLRGSVHLTHIKKFHRTKDGRGAVLNLRAILTSKDNIATLADKNMDVLTNLTYDGTITKKWSFDKFILTHAKCHNRNDHLKKYGHTELNENGKVRYLHNGITDKKLESCVLAMKANTDKFSTFTACAEYVTTHIAKIKTPRISTVNISSVGGSRRGRGGRGGGRGGNHVPGAGGPTADNYDKNKDYSQFAVANKYYARPEWLALTADQRNYMRS